jgi:hypothetical protein
MNEVASLRGSFNPSSSQTTAGNVDSVRHALPGDRYATDLFLAARHPYVQWLAGECVKLEATQRAEIEAIRSGKLDPKLSTAGVTELFLVCTSSRGAYYFLRHFRGLSEVRPNLKCHFVVFVISQSHQRPRPKHLNVDKCSLPNTVAHRPSSLEAITE